MQSNLPRGNERSKAATDEATLAEWQLVDRRLRTYRHQRAQLDAAELFDLVRAESMKLHWMLGHSTMLEYMEFALGYTPHVARERLRVARALVQLPATSGALATGQLPFSAVRELTRVATEDTERDWLERARDKTVHEIEEMVTGRAPGDRPDDPTRPDLRERRLGLSLPPQAFALWRQARTELANERGAEVTDAELLETLCRRFLAPGTGEASPAHQIAYTQCRDCKRATQNGAGREIDIAPEVFDCAACDARVIGSVDGSIVAKAMSTVTKRMREQVFARDHGRCQVPGCRATRNLDIHHIISQADGGPHEMWNLLVLCSGHHAAHHAGLISITGRAGSREGLSIRWTNRPPWTPDEAAAFRKTMADEDELAYLLRERKPRGRSAPRGEARRNAVSQVGHDDARRNAVSHVGHDGPPIGGK
ncbi:MAG: HNH endonuclease [Kofleriaceae bacterium]|nr:HNH endonuclease [Kofleriaceae bacterium]